MGCILPKKGASRQKALKTAWSFLVVICVVAVAVAVVVVVVVVVFVVRSLENRNKDAVLSRLYLQE